MGDTVGVAVPRKRQFTYWREMICEALRGHGRLLDAALDDIDEHLADDDLCPAGQCHGGHAAGGRAALGSILST